MKDQIQTSIIDTLSYFDVFDYPLTLEQIELYLHFSIVDKKAIKKALEKIVIIDSKYGYYFFSGRKGIAIKRKIHEVENKRKTFLAARYIRMLSKVPGVKLVALTGSLSMGNASIADDIDLFIITRKNMLWATRLMVILITKILGKKREYRGRDHKDKLCMNMFLDEREMEFSDRNLYIAHEIVQMKVYFDEHAVFNRFVSENAWIKDFFPNIAVRKKTKRINRWFGFMFFSERLLRFVNLCLFIVQYIYMSSKITREKVSLRKAFFHPNDGSIFILEQYKKRRKYYIDRYTKAIDLKDFEARRVDLRKSRIKN